MRFPLPKRYLRSLNHFLRTPASVLLRLFTALFAAGVFTAFPEEAGALGLGLVWVAPRLLPVVPWFRAFAVLEPGVPPVPLMVLPFESVLPDPLVPVEELELVPLELCAPAPVAIRAKQVANPIIDTFMVVPPLGTINPSWQPSS
jgi:hypothetical protein